MNSSKFYLYPFYFFYVITILLGAYFIEPMHDYGLYFRHWELVLSGGDPWQKMGAANAYGPIYNLFAWVYAIDKQWPKMVFVVSWLFISIYTFIKFSALNVNFFQKMVFFAFWFFNPFFIVATVFYGFNDSFVALLVFLGLLIALRFKNHIAGPILITLGVLTKMYPLFLLPFLTPEKKVMMRNIAIFIVILVFAYLLTYVVWGGSFVNAFGKANGRDPTLFSIMRFVDGAYFPSHFLAQIIIGLTNLFILLGVGYVFYLFKKGRIDQATAFLTGFTMLLTFYKAGQQQFYLTYFAIFAVWSLYEFNKALPNIQAFYAVLLLGLWMAVMAGVVYPMTYMSGSYEWVRDIIGLPTFMLQLLILYFLLRPAYRLT